MSENNISSPNQGFDHLIDMVHRVLVLRRSRSQTLLPPDLASIKTRVIEANLNAKTFDIIYLLGIMISRQAEPLTMSEISQALEVPMSTATRVVDWFVRNGFAARLPDPSDRRVVRITLTEAGMAVYRATNEFIGQRVQTVLSHFTSTERVELTRLLDKLIRILEQEP
jgi:DNA-binding MarR family transcriptional regulator